MKKKFNLLYLHSPDENINVIKNYFYDRNINIKTEKNYSLAVKDLSKNRFLLVLIDFDIIDDKNFNSFYNENYEHYKIPIALVVPCDVFCNKEIDNYNHLDFVVKSADMVFFYNQVNILLKYSKNVCLDRNNINSAKNDKPIIHKDMTFLLKSSEDYFRILFEESPFPIELSHNGINIDANKAFLKMFGYETRDEIYGKSLLIFIAYEAYDDIKSKIFKRSNGLNVETAYESIGIRKDGTKFNFYVNVDRVFINNRFITVAFFEDITERKKAENDSKKSEEKYERLVSNINCLVCELDLDGKYTYCNNKYYEVLGYTPEELLGTSALEKIHPEDLVIAREKYKDLTEKENQSIEIWRYKHKNGHYMYFECRGSVYFDINRKKKTVIIATDIDERINSEKRINYLSSFPEMNNSPIIEVNESAEILYKNRSFDRLVGDHGLDKNHTWVKIENLGKLKKSLYDERIIEYKNKWFFQNIHYIAENNSIRIYSIDITKRMRVENSIKDIISMTSGKFGYDYFKSICLIFSSTLKADFVIIGEMDSKGSDTLNALYAVSGNDIIESFTCSLKSIPFQNIMKYGPHSCSKETQFEFKESGLIKSLRVEAYIGVPLYNSDKKVFGVLMAMYCKSQPGLDFAESILKLFAGRVSNEIERLHALEKLKMSEERHKSLIENLYAAIIVCDASGDVKLLNQKALKILSLSEEEIIGKSIINSSWILMNNEKTLLLPEMNPIKYVLQTKKELKNYELSLKKSEGDEEIWFLCNAYPGFINNKLDYIVASFVDITEWKKSIMEKEQLEEQLRQAHKMEAVGQLAGGVAHDFNNILQVILGYTDVMILESPSVESQIFSLYEIKKAAERASSLTNQLLAFSRRQVLKIDEFNINNIIKDIRDMIKSLIGDSISLEIKLEPTPGIIKADRNLIEQVLINLCVNARDSMKDGGQLIISTEVIEIDDDFCLKNIWASPGEYVLIKVSDTGTGMADEILDQIFEPFFTTKEVGKGTGLGLSTSYGIIQQHNGGIIVESELSKGTTFSIYFSCYRDKKNEYNKKEEFSEVKGGKETILLAEDNDSIRHLSIKMLKKAGYNVIGAKNGVEAIELYHCNKSKIDLLLLDIVMQKKSGKDVYDELLKIDPNIKCLFVSGYNEKNIHDDFILLQGLHFIQKPYDYKLLIKTVRTVLEK